MSTFAQLQAKAQQTQTQDVDFSGKFTVDSGAYPAKVRLAYIDYSKRGAAFVALDLILTVNGKPRRYKEEIYFSNAQGDLTYKDNNGKDMPLPGYTTLDTICKLACGKTLGTVTTEMKKVKLKNRQTQQEELVDKEIIMDLLNTDFIAGILEVEEDHWDTENKFGQTQMKNNISKVFSSTGHTEPEHTAKTEAKYIDGWKEQNTGKVVVKAKNKGKSNGVQSGAPSGNTPQAGSLFGQ